MGKKTIILIIGIFLIGIYLFYNFNVNPLGGYDEFTLCLSESGLKMYGTEWCSHCKNQKKLFGNSFKNIDYIDCDKNKDICLSEGIRGYPTWKTNGQKYPGEQSLNKLSELTGCEL